ncbi:MAG: glycoside hydrolase family 5 protein [Planctomycetota bacterium]
MTQSLTRRTFVKATCAAAAASALPLPLARGASTTPALPRWRGFNLTNFFQALSKGEQSSGELNENDLRWMRDWGFDFVRLPMDYWLWIDSDWRKTRTLSTADMFKLDEAALAKVDRAIDLCAKYNLHVNVNFHRAPGYCINDPEREPAVLWTNREAQDAFTLHWDTFARRYKGIPRKTLSFNLVNEAPRPREGYMTREQYVDVMRRATEAIRRHSPERIVMVDGFSVGTEVVTEMIPDGVAQSVHAYWPGGISHYKAGWVNHKGEWIEPTWPLKDKKGKVTADREMLVERYKPWGELVQKGIGAHCGEAGCYNKTPYPVFIAWFTDVMEILKGHQIGYALWNLRGAFGVVDSGRTDIEYEDFQGHKLDRQLLTVLQKY